MDRSGQHPTRGPGAARPRASTSRRLDVDAFLGQGHAARVTLADLLVSTAVLGLTLGATLVTLQQGQQVWAVGTARVDAQQSARAGLAWLSAELRGAGQGTDPRRAPALALVEPTRIVLHVDRDGDGAIGGPTEVITWRLAGDILRRDAGGGAQPVINAVRSLGIVAFDAAGAATAEPRAVRRLRITLVTAADHARSRDGRDLGAVFTTDVQLRNR
jgi:hypothetical protein